jgi:hypothetical protein
MHQPKSLRRLIVFGKYYLTHFKEVEKWFRTHDRSDLPAPAWVMDNPSGDEPFLGPETDGDPLTNVAATAFLAGRAIRDSEVDCDDRDIVTTANYVAVRASLRDVGLNDPRQARFTVDEGTTPPLVHISGRKNSVDALIREWSSFMADPWNGERSFAAECDML